MTRSANWMAELPYHMEMIDWEQVGNRPGDRILDIFDWLYEEGPDNNDWYAMELPDTVQYLVNQAVVHKKITKFTFAFRHKKDAVFFKLRFM